MRRLAGPDLHRRSPDGGDQDRTSRNPGCPTDENSMGFVGGTAVPTSQGSKTSEAERLLEARQDVTMLVIPLGQEHQDPTYAHSGCVDCFRSACYGRPASHRRGTCQLWSRSKRRSGSLSALVGRRSPCGARHPYLVTRAALLRRSLHAHKSRDKGSYERWYLAGVRLLRLRSTRPTPVLSARVIQSTCSDATQRKISVVAQPHSEWGGARTCLDRNQVCMERRAWTGKGPKCAEVAPRPRVLCPSCAVSSRTMLRVWQL